MFLTAPTTPSEPTIPESPAGLSLCCIFITLFKLYEHFFNKSYITSRLTTFSLHVVLII